MVARTRKVVAVALAVCLAAMLTPAVASAKSRGSGVGAQQVVSVPADAYESDDTTTQAKVYPKRSLHTLDSYEDEDWMKLVVATAGTPYVFETQIIGGNDDFDLQLFIYQQNPDGTVTELDDRDDHFYWNAYSEYLVWTAPAAGTYYAVVMGYDSGATGTYALYWDAGFARRVYGADRSMTAIEVSKLMYQQYSISYDWDFDTSGIVIANGADFADAMAGGLLATVVDGPVLLSSPVKGLSGETRAEIGRILRPVVYYEDDPVTIYVLGGTAAVPAAVEAQLKAIPEVASGIKNGKLTIMRINGATRFDTAAAVAAEVDDKIGVSDTVYIINGYAWADGLAVAAPSCWSISPVLLTTPGALSPATASAITSLGATKAVIVGGTAVVSPAVETALNAQLGDANVSRISGDDRYKTALAVAKHAVDDVGLEGDRLILVSGENWPDALGAGPMVRQYEYDGGVEGPILLTRPARLSDEVATFVHDYGRPEEICYVVGGPAALSDAVVAAFNKLRTTP